MKTRCYGFFLCSVMTSFTFLSLARASSALGENGVHFCGYTGQQPDNRRYARTLANLNVGEPRIVRMIYFLPNDRPYRGDIVQQIKDEIRTVQTFYAEAMGAHSYGKITFRIETDSHDEPIVHRVDGEHPLSHYFNNTSSMLEEIEQGFDLGANIYLIVIGNSFEGVDSIGRGSGRNKGKSGGHALVYGGFPWFLAAHELGHAFGLAHDFRNGAYIMSYGNYVSLSPEMDQLSACHAEYLSVHPHFNPAIPIEEGSPPIIELISSNQYPAEAKSIPIELKVSDSDGLHQVLLHVQGLLHFHSNLEVCRGLTGEKNAIVEFDYDGVIPFAHDPSYSRSTSLANPPIRWIDVQVVDVDGNMDSIRSVLLSEAVQPLSKISGDNQHGLPNTPLPVPFVVEVRDLNDGSARNKVPVMFTITAGSGTLSVEHTKTNFRGRAESTLTLGPNLGVTTVEVSAGGITVTFNASAGGAVNLPDLNLRTAIENALGKGDGEPIAPAEMATLTHFKASNSNISNLTGLEHATNLKTLDLGGEKMEAENRWVNSNSVTDISPLMGLTNLRWLDLYRNNISDISALVENAGLGSGDRVSMIGNPLNYPSIYTHIPALQERGVEVFFGIRTPQWPRIVSGNDQGGLPGAALANPFVVEVRDERGDAFEGVTVTFTVTAGDGTLSTTNTTTNAQGRAQSILTLGLNPGTNTVVVSVIGVEKAQTFTAKGIRLPLAFWIIIGDKQQGLVGSALANPFVVEVRGHAGEPFLDAQVTFTVTSGGGTLSVTSVTTDANGRAESTLTLGPNPGTNTVAVSVTGIQETQTVTAFAESPRIPEDVNRDDVVNILDLVSVASVLGEAGQDLMADVNGDGIVNILDLVLVAGALGNAAAAPSAWYRDLERDFHGNSIAFAIHSLDPSLSTRFITPTRADVVRWLAQAGEVDLTDPASRRGVLFLEQLLAALTPKETALLPNYPNPFNPETWIPYQLSEDADVMLTIYDSSGIMVRRLKLGHRLARYYADRGKAAYWDGRNVFGENVASGVYFYHLSAGNYSAARRMLILK